MKRSEKRPDDPQRSVTDEQIALIDQEIANLHLYCVHKGIDLDTLENLTDPIFDLIHRYQVISYAKIFLLLFVFSLSTFFIISLTPIHRLLVVYARHLSIKVLPYWDWTNLYYKECLVNNPFFERNKLISEDCQVCESVEIFDHLGNVTHEEIAENYLKADIPVIISDATYDWPVMFDPFSVTNITEIYLQHDQLDEIAPCSLSTNLKVRGENFFKKFLRKIHFQELEKWFGHWENCDKQASKAIRHLYFRPYFLPAMVDTSEPNWIFISNNYRSRTYKKVELLSDMMWFAQIRGKNYIRLTPKEPCKSVCVQLEDVLYEGDTLLFTDLMWQFEYLPGDEDEENIAFAAGGFWEM